MAGSARGSIGILALGLVALLGTTAFDCEGLGPIQILVPAEGQLSLPGDVEAEVRFPGFARKNGFQALLDGDDVSALFTLRGRVAEATLPGLDAGEHELAIQIETRFGAYAALRRFQVIEFAHSDACEALNQLECVLPYPSDHFRKEDPVAGHQLVIPQEGIPKQVGNEIPASHFLVRDGFSPTVQALMHFPAGVDVEASGLARLLAEPSRSTDYTSLRRRSPSILLEMPQSSNSRGRRVLHWVENDSRVDGPERRLLFLRPGRSLLPGHRYIVALRNLVDDAGNPVEPEPVFRALRDGTPTTIPSVEARRAHFEELFHQLRRAGIHRRDLVLAFDFTVASDENLTGQMLSMRDQTFDWLAALPPAQGVIIDEFHEDTERFDCSVPGQQIWKKLRGRYPVPLFLSDDPETNPVPRSFLQVGADGVTPVYTTTTQAEFGISIPCAALEAPVSAMVAGHGLFGDGPGFALDMGEFIPGANADYDLEIPAKITGGTHWRGMASPDFKNPAQGPSFIVNSIAFGLPGFAALPDRMRQGQLNQLVLARMMKQGLLNAHPEFQAPAGHGVFEVDGDMPYFGISLGGVMGLMFAALSPDVERLNTDVPSINFSLLLQRATPFLLFQFALDISVDSLDGSPRPDPLSQIVGLQILHELWVTGESAGYATHITNDPLPGTNAKQVLMTMAFLDQQVSNQATEISARTLGLPSLRGSFLSGLPLIPDLEGPLDSALVVYDTGSLDLNDPTRADLIPPLANKPPIPHGGCDPHARRVGIPASIMQLAAFLQPGGSIENFCDGTCDADPAAEAIGPIGLFRLEMPGGDGSDCPPAPLP